MTVCPTDKFGLPILNEEDYPPMPKNVKPPKSEKLPKPEGPPCQEFKETFWKGLVETKESKQKRLDYQNYIRGWHDAMRIGGT